MQDSLMVTGIVLKALPVGEYDKVLTILTQERGKISAFARNARKMNNPLMAAANLFCFGHFRLYAGKNAYTIAEAQISQYFDELHKEPEAACYGMYFLEVADYYTRENNEEQEMLKLVYQSLRALSHPKFSNEFVRAVFECKAMAVNGEFPGVLPQMQVSDIVRYTIGFIAESSVEKLYSFTIPEDALLELEKICELYCERIWNHSFKSLSILQNFTVEKQN
jgi:DNA repair protein RecO (recombination protein O)